MREKESMKDSENDGFTEKNAAAELAEYERRLETLEMVGPVGRGALWFLERAELLAALERRTEALMMLDVFDFSMQVRSVFANALDGSSEESENGSPERSNAEHAARDALHGLGGLEGIDALSAAGGGFEPESTDRAEEAGEEHGGFKLDLPEAYAARFVPMNGAMHPVGAEEAEEASEKGGDVGLEPSGGTQTFDSADVSSLPNLAELNNNVAPEDEARAAELRSRLRAEIAMPVFRVPFRDRLKASWKMFLAEAEALTQTAQSDPDGAERAAVRIREIFHPAASAAWRISIRAGAERPMLIFSPQGWRLTAFTTAECVRAAPAGACALWDIRSGEPARAAEEIPTVTVGGRILSPDDFRIVPQRDEGDEWRLAFWSEELRGIDDSETGPVFAALEEMIRMCLGEAVQMRWFAALSILTRSPQTFVALRELPDYVRECVPAAQGFSMEEYLRLALKVMAEPEQDPDCDLLLDSWRYETICPPLHNAYGMGRHESMAELDAQGASAGFVCLIFDDDLPKAERVRLRRALREHLDQTLPADTYLTTGEGSALRYEYVEGFVWSLPEVLEAAAGWLEGEHGVKEACWHSFLRRADIVRIKGSGDEGLLSRLEKRREDEEPEAFQASDPFLSEIDQQPGAGEHDAVHEAQAPEWTMPGEEVGVAPEAEDELHVPEAFSNAVASAADAYRSAMVRMRSRTGLSTGGCTYDSKRAFPAEPGQNIGEEAAEPSATGDPEGPDIKENSMTQHLIGAVRDYLDKINVTADFDEEHQMFQTGSELENALQRCSIVIGIQKNTLHCYAVSPLRATPEHLSDIIEFVTRANYGLKRGAFEVDCADGEIRCHTYADCFDETVPQQVLSFLVSTPVQLFYQYGDGIVAVLSGEMKPEEAVRMCEAQLMAQKTEA